MTSPPSLPHLSFLLQFLINYDGGSHDLRYKLHYNSMKTITSLLLR